MKSVTDYNVVIAQYRLLHYRVELFEILHRLCAEEGITLHLIHGNPSNRELARKDVGSISWSTPVRNWFLNLKNIDVLWQETPRRLKSADLFIVMQENRIISNYFLILSRFFQGKKVAYWGHGINFQSKSPHGLRERWKKFWLTKVSWWFSYTDLTTGLLEGAGYPKSNISTLNNAVNTQLLKSQVDAVSDEVVTGLRNELGISEKSKVAVFCGSIYPDKKPELLVSASDLVRKSVDDYHLIVIGDGPSAQLLHDAAKTRPWLHMVGVQKSSEKAAYYRLADIMLNPGLLGLHILDAFCLGMPILSTKNALHSPEISYLVNGENGLLTDDTPESFSEPIIKLFSDHGFYEKISSNALLSSEKYSVETMAANFMDGIKACLVDS